MSDEPASRDALRELLFDDVAPPPGAEAMFAVTFAATGTEGAELLPPDDLFDAEPTPDGSDAPAPDELPLDDPLSDDPLPDDLFPDDPALDDLPVDAPHPADGADPIPDPAVDPVQHDDPGTGW